MKDIEDIKSLISKHGESASLEIMRDLALSGNFICQKFFLTQFLSMPNENKTPEIIDLTEKFLLMTAESGDLDSQFNLALFYIKKVGVDGEYLYGEDIELLSKARYWYGKAVGQGQPRSAELDEYFKVMPDIS